MKCIDTYPLEEHHPHYFSTSSSLFAALGRIMNRLSQDVYCVDEQLPSTISSFMSTFMTVFATVIVIIAVTPWFALGVIPLFLFYVYVQRYYITTSRELQRLDSISKSPIYANFSESLQGTSTIRAYDKCDLFMEKNEKLLDKNQVAYYYNMSANRWLAVRLETLGALIVAGSTLFAVLNRFNMNPTFPSFVGLSISTALSVTQSLNWLIRTMSDAETQIVSVERIKEYVELPKEQEVVPGFEPISPPVNWPSNGKIEIQNLKLQYRYNTPEILHGISATIDANDKIGIVGRTGAGKSSLIFAFFRMADVQNGEIFIDGIPISRVPLPILRSKLCIIPQDPVLFSGTLRKNLDPLRNYSDDEIWNSLRVVSLDGVVSQLPNQLDSNVADGGSNFSTGQRQLFTVARALLRRAKIIILDEASASLDYDSDAALQKAIRAEFANSTVLTIAHRINTILDSTKIMFLSKGNIIEFDSPNVLLQSDTAFSKLVQESHASATRGTETSA
jgi:ABC-type multidrug transport system fused ATPase/permease subunit